MRTAKGELFAAVQGKRRRQLLSGIVKGFNAVQAEKELSKKHKKMSGRCEKMRTAKGEIFAAVQGEARRQYSQGLVKAVNAVQAEKELSKKHKKMSGRGEKNETKKNVGAGWRKIGARARVFLFTRGERRR